MPSDTCTHSAIGYILRILIYRYSRANLYVLDSSQKSSWFRCCPCYSVHSKFLTPYFALSQLTISRLLATSNPLFAQTMAVLAELFYGLTCQDLAPEFEDSHGIFFAAEMRYFMQLMEWDPPQLQMCVSSALLRIVMLSHSSPTNLRPPLYCVINFQAYYNSSKGTHCNTHSWTQITGKLHILQTRQSTRTCRPEVSICGVIVDMTLVKWWGNH
jgi:hypothetical protein